MKVFMRIFHVIDGKSGSKIDANFFFCNGAVIILKKSSI